eukprot:1658129-Pyramimonas_sp.AAC.1
MMETKKNPEFETYTEFNHGKATGHFAACFDRSCGADISHGTRLCLLLRAIVAGARRPVPAGM